MHRGRDRGLVLAEPGKTDARVRFAGKGVEAVALAELVVARAPRQAAATLEEAARKLHGVICAARNFDNAPKKPTLDQIRAGQAPPIWSDEDAACGAARALAPARVVEGARSFVGGAARQTVDTDQALRLRHVVGQRVLRHALGC